ncbi:ATP-dependent DNA helicase [Alicyclobacillus sp. SP_1]|uniref:ATP-dependent helicase n=1 Tax=Alicyclobacillus sp. SP_1 TaxID=2942475 RepID=UPI002158632D|nr:ATP-dependent DNA helicase [Alicyclobacillus sp. SP_1]
MLTEQILRNNLTENQYNAVVDNGRYILCLACAGSGKSRTLAYKIAYLVSQGKAPESIVAFTFTEKAAESIKRRVAEALHKCGLPENYVGVMFIGTVDSFCQKLLGDINARYRQYDILDQNRLILFIMSRLRQLGLSNGPGYFRTITDLTKAWQTLNNENIPLDSVQSYDPDLYDKLKRLSNRLESDGYMDFSFAISLAVKELKNITHKEDSYIAKFKYLFVDEYQDINPLQEEFIRTFASHLDMLFVVGDDDQSIYGWRGANVQNILTFTDRYPDVSIHRLLINFRSTKAIVETANNFVQRTIPVERLPKDITFHADGNIQDLRKLWFGTREEEAEWVAERIKSLLGTTYVEYNADGSEKSRRGLTYSDFAVLIRSIRNSNGENRDVQFVNAMRNLDIPVKTTGEGGIFDRPYAQCILGIMELLREERIDRGIAETYFTTYVFPFFPFYDKTRYLRVLQDWYRDIYTPTSTARRKVYPQNFLHQLADALMLRDLTDETALRDVGLFSDIIKDVEQTYVSIDSKYRYREMLNFLQNIAQNNYELESPDYIAKDDAVNVSTIHKVKGLEFPVVFVVDLVAQRFPGRSETYNGILPRELMIDAVNRGAYGSRMEDEARLFYTAITRAERLLYLTGSSIHPNLRRTKKQSVFIANLTHPTMREDKTFDDLDEKIEPRRRFDDNELPTDFSAVKGYLTCPYIYKLQNIYGYNAAVPELFGFGQTTHTILERLHQTYKDRVPTEAEVSEMVESTFMLKHVFPSNDPENRPGSYERAKILVDKILKQYVKDYASDFCRIRQDEARFELSVEDALITGAIDLLLKEDEHHGILSAEVIDFKSMDLPDDVEQQDWRDMSVQVQLYSKAAREVIGDNAKTGFVHTLKNNKRVEIPVDESSVNRAIGAIEWAVKGILANDFPMRPCQANCGKCDFTALCVREHQPFRNQQTPPLINTPTGLRPIAALDTGEEDHGQHD